jgi:hypothetical protein
MASKKTLRTCLKGHQFYKSSDCPVCPVCEGMKEDTEFYSGLASPARRALENAGISSVSQLAGYTQAEVLSFHGMGPGSIPKLKRLLNAKNLDFRKKR